MRASVEPRAKSDDVWSDDTWTRLAARLDYVALDATSADELEALKAKTGDGSVTAFMAVSPSLYGRIVPAMHAAGLAGPDTRIVLEKPVGRDLESFRELDDGCWLVQFMDLELGYLDKTTKTLLTTKNLAS